MKREIKFGERSALLHNGEKCAKIYIDEPTLPVALADCLNKEQGIDVTEVSKHEKGSCIRMFHELTGGEILGIVCDAIGEVYNEDATVSYARPENAV